MPTWSRPSGILLSKKLQAEQFLTKVVYELFQTFVVLKGKRVRSSNKFPSTQSMQIRVPLPVFDIVPHLERM